MSDKPHETEADVLLGLKMAEWEWLLQRLASKYYLAHNLEGDEREAWLVGLLSGQYRRQRALLETTAKKTGETHEAARQEPEPASTPGSE